MKKLYTLAFALLASLAFTAPAHAAFLIDGFGDDHAAAVDGLADSTEVASSDNSVTLTDTDFDFVQRDLFVDKLSGGGNVDLEVKDGALSYASDPGVDPTAGVGRVVWKNLDPQRTINPTISVLVDVLFNDRSDGNAKIVLTMYGDETDSDEFFLPCVDSTNDDCFDSFTGVFTLSNFSAASLTNISMMELKIDGALTPGLDLTLDLIEVPAPGILGLLGVGLAGLAFATRRRNRSVESRE